jgi:hypothetical protein
MTLSSFTLQHTSINKKARLKKRRRGEEEEEEEERKSICVVRQKRAGFLYIAIAHNNARRTRRQRVCTKKSVCFVSLRAAPFFVQKLLERQGGCFTNVQL